MPRVHKKRKNKAGATRECGQCGKTIKPGEEYFTWSFRYGGPKFRCIDHPPKQSDLTQSKMGTIYFAIEGAEEELEKVEAVEDIEALIESVAESCHEVAGEYEEAAEYFGGEGENRERADEVLGFAEELEQFAPESDDLDEVKEEAKGLLESCPL